MISPMTRKALTKQGYALVGSHSGQCLMIAFFFGILDVYNVGYIKASRRVVGPSPPFADAAIVISIR
jgi:hypothetical protein